MRKTPTTAVLFSHTHPGSPTGSSQFWRYGFRQIHFQFLSAHFLFQVIQSFWLMCAFVFYLFLIKGRIECNSLDSEGGLLRGKTDCTIDRPIFKTNTKVCLYKRISSHSCRLQKQFCKIRKKCHLSQSFCFRLFSSSLMELIATLNMTGKFLSLQMPPGTV